ncbi:MAG: hypothetical protein WC364_04950 [Eubacteriales bacterium]|jgi:hypothetical protein
MTVAEICKYACTYLLNKPTSYIVAATEGVNWINEWQEESVDLIKNFATQALNGCVANTWYSLPADCAKIYEVRDSSDNIIKVSDYIADLGQISFSYDGTYEIMYYQIPTAVTLGSSTPDCHALFHKVIAYWLAYKKTSLDAQNIETIPEDQVKPSNYPWEKWEALYEKKMASVLRGLQRRAGKNEVEVRR